MKQRHRFIGLAVLGTAAPIALGALITGNAMAADGADDTATATISMIVPDPDGDGSMECTIDGIDMSGEGVLAVSTEFVEGSLPTGADPADGQVFTVSVSAVDATEGSIEAGEQTGGEGTIVGQATAIPVDGSTVNLVPFDFGDVRDGTPEECAAIDQPLVGVVEAP